MAIEIRERRRASGASVLAVVRVGRFKSASKTFRVETTVAAAKKEAKAWARAYQDTLQSKARKPRSDVTQLTIADLVREYRKDPAFEELKTRKDVDRLAGWFVTEYAHTKVRDFGVSALREARDKLRHGRGPATVNRYLSAFRAIWHWGISAELVLGAWPKKLLLKEPRGRIRFLSDEEISRLLKAAEKDTVMHSAIKVACMTGLRLSEMLRLRWQDIDLGKGVATIHETKNEQRRAVHLNAAAVEALTVLQKAKVRSMTWVFTNVHGQQLTKSLLEMRWRPIRTAAKLEDYHWHDHRHTAASILLQNGATLAAVGQVLGHKSPAMSFRYAHLVQGAAVAGHDKLAEKFKGK